MVSAISGPVIDDDTARAVLDELYHLPETNADGPHGLHHRLADHGLEAIADRTSLVTSVRGRDASQG